MKYALKLLFALLLAPLVALSAADAPKLAAKPNIIVILADDIGYGDLSCYGAKMVQTPNLDRLAADGRRFMDAHSPAATCTPSRRALMTGVYSWRQPEGCSIAPGDAAMTIKPGTFTLPSMLTGGTDMGPLRAKGVQAYGIGPLAEEIDALAHGAHTDDERLGEAALYKFVEFLWQTVIEVSTSR